MPGHTKTPTRFRDRTELLDFLLEVAAVTSSTLNLDELLANLATIIQEVVPYDLFAVLLYSDKSKGLTIRYSIGHREEIVRRLVIPLSDGITGAAATERKPILVGDVLNDPRYLRTVDAVRTELAVPMMTRDHLVGIIDLQSTRANAYTEEDSALVRLIASRVAVSVENARLYRRIERQNRTLRMLASLSHEYSSTLSLDELFNRIATTVRQLINYHAFSILLLDEKRKLLRSRFSLRYDERVNMDNVPLGRGITGAAVESKRPVRVDDTGADPRYIESIAGIRSEVAIPLLLPDRVVGVMDLESEQAGFFTEDHVRTLSLLAPLISSAVENARLYEELTHREQRMEADLKAARELQFHLLLRRPPEIAGLEIGTAVRPAHEISGDIYDFFEKGEEYAVITFGDVSGKGAAAALYGALVSGLLRTLAPRRASPASLMQSLNSALGERKVAAQYVTLLVLFWHSRTRLCTMASAGVFPPIICRQGRILKQRVEGVPLGLLDNNEYEESTFQAEPGDVILLYSDGIHDQHNPAGEDYGRGRLYSLLEAHWRQPSQAIADSIFADLDRFADGIDIFDDQTVVVMKVT